MDIEDLEYILDHYKYPSNYGSLTDPDISHEEGNPFCDDIVRLDLKIKDNKVKDVKFSGKGCTISQAAASILTEMIINKNLDQIKSITGENMLKTLNITVSPVRYKCALLALKVLKSALYGLKNWPGEEED